MIKQDVGFERNEDDYYDLAIKDNDFLVIDGFDTAILASLFTDKRAPDFSVPDENLRRGSVADILTADIGRALGSTLWLYDQSRITQDILNQIKVAADDCFLWMLEDNIARRVVTEVIQDDIRRIVVNINITSLTGQEQRYTILWRNTPNGNTVSNI